MAVHVDLIENRWSGGYQERVAKVFVGVDGIEVEGSEHYRHLLLSNATAAESPTKFLDGLADRYQGDYLFATEPHDDERCAFTQAEQVSLEQVAAPQPAVASR